MHPVPLASIAVFRILFGLVALVFSVRFILRGWVGEFYGVPEFFFPFIGADWCRPPDGWILVGVFVVQALAALCLSLGLLTRFAALVFFLSFTWPELWDKTYYLNHYYLVSLLALLLIFIPSGGLYSMDSWLRPISRCNHGPAWMLWLLRFQIGLVYFFAGVGKLNGDWLLHAQPLRIWLAASVDVPLIGPWLAAPWMAWAMSWGGALFDLCVPFALLHARTRVLAFCGLVVFHVLTGVLFPLGMFPWVMLAGVSLFFPADWPARWLGLGKPHVVGANPLPMIAAGIYALVQVAIPLRQFAIPGNVLWHEQGFRFSWNVMLVDKFGDARFIAVHRVTGEETEIRNRDWLTPQQERMMSTQPDMILQFARHLAKHHPGCEIRGDVWVAWNGRAAARLIDPNVDLSRCRDPLSACLPAPAKD